MAPTLNSQYLDSLLKKQNILSEKDVPFQFNYQSLPEPERNISPAVSPEKEKTNWQEILTEMTPALLAMYGLSSPGNYTAGISATNTWNNLQEQKRQRAMQDYQQKLEEKNQVMNEAKFGMQQNEYVTIDDNVLSQIPEQYRSYFQPGQKVKRDELIGLVPTNKSIDPLQQRLTESQIAENFANADRMKREPQGADNSAAQQRLAQQQKAAQMIAVTSQYRSKKDFIADLQKHSKEIGLDNYNKIMKSLENFETSEKIWPTDGVGVNFVPGQSSPIRRALYGDTKPRKQLVADNKSVNKTTASKKTKGKIVRTGTDKKTGQKVVQYEDGTIEYKS